MSAGDLITAAWQVELNGLLMGPDTVYVTRELDLWAAPEVRASETNRAGAHGLFTGRDWLAGRQVAASFYVEGTDDTEEISNRQALTAAWSPPDDGGTVPLVWMEDDGVLYRLVGKPRLASPKVQPGIPTDCRFIATDPRIYANVEQTATTGLAPTVGGLSFPASAPFVFGSASAGNIMSCPNNGTIPTSWVATFTGPLVAPQLDHVGQGLSLSLPGCTLAASETLVVDSDARTVMLNGTASRYSWLSSVSRWFDLDPGSNSVRLTGASGSGNVVLTWRSAWI